MRKFLGMLMVLVGLVTLCSCRTEDTVQNNLLRQTGNFQTYRKISVINLRSDKILMEFEGYLTTKIDGDKDVDIMIMIGPGQYKLHYVHLADEVVYVCEQLENSTTDPYHWEIRIFVVAPDIILG